MAILLANNAKSTLAVALGGIDTTLVVATGTETLFPSPTGGDYFYATLENSSKTIREIVKCTARSGTTLTIVRAQDDSTANIFAVGSTIEMRVNKGALTDSVVAASNYATNAASSASAASTSASNASTSANTATTQATTATTQAGIATTQAGNAAASASAANTSAIAAAAAAASGLYSAVQDKSANYTVVAGDAGDLLRVTTTSGAVTITLPTISTVGDGFKIAIVKWTSDGNPVNVNRSGSDTINGATSIQIGSQYSQVILVADLETSTWFASQSGLGATNVNVDVFSGNGSTTAFTLTSDPSTKNNTYVSISGVYQAKSTYSVSGTTLTFSTAPPSGTSNIEVVYGTPLVIGTPSDNTVSTAKIVDANVTTAKVADANITPAKLSADAQYMGFKNRIINGAMQIDQRNGGASSTPSGASAGTYTLDRWCYQASQTGKFTVQQNAGSVTPPAGFSKYLGLTVASAVTIGAGDYFGIYQAIEGLNVSDLGWGAAGAATITLSFWVRSSLTGTFGGSFENGNSDRSYPFTYTISAANTWEQKSITVAGDTTGTWLTTNGVGLFIRLGLGVGSTYSGTANAWVAGDKESVTGAVSVVGTLGATWYVTGVQLEKGSTATSFDYRPYGTELALCQRYCPVWKTSSASDIFGSGYNASATIHRAGTPLPVTPRVPPTGATFSAASDFIASSNVNMTGSSIAFYTSSPTTAWIVLTGAGGQTAGGGGYITVANANAQIIFTGCEL